MSSVVAFTGWTVPLSWLWVVVMALFLVQWALELQGSVPKWHGPRRGLSSDAWAWAGFWFLLYLVITGGGGLAFGIAMGATGLFSSGGLYLMFVIGFGLSFTVVLRLFRLVSGD